MSLYPPPQKHNGSLNTVFNRDDYIQTTNSSAGTTQLQNDARYLRNTGTVVSSGATTFNNSVDINGLATMNNLNVTSLLKSKQYADDLNNSAFTASQKFSFNNGLVYTLDTNSTVMTTILFTDIPITPQQSYKFTFIMKPDIASSAYYLKPNTDFVTINGISSPLYGLSNIILPATFTYLLQQITLINTSTTTTPSFISLTRVSGY